jgi:hypothetical protein
MMSTNALTPDEQFVIYYDRLRNELNKAYTHYQICKSLRERSRTNTAEFNEAFTFFARTIDANLFVTVMTISRFTDKRGDSLHLNVFFEFIKNNVNIFSVEEFKRRLLDKGRDSEYCEHWAKGHIEITAEMVDQDKAKVENLPIHNIRLWRDKKIAHIEKELALKNIDVMKESPVAIHEIDDVLGTFHEILDRYRRAYDGTQWIPNMPLLGQQIEYVMEALKYYRQPKRNRDRST